MVIRPVNGGKVVDGGCVGGGGGVVGGLVVVAGAGVVGSVVVVVGAGVVVQSGASGNKAHKPIKR